MEPTIRGWKPCTTCDVLKLSSTDLDDAPIGKLIRHPLLMRRTTMRRMQDMGRQTVLGTGDGGRERRGCGQCGLSGVRHRWCWAQVKGGGGCRLLGTDKGGSQVVLGTGKEGGVRADLLSKHTCVVGHG